MALTAGRVPDGDDDGLGLEIGLAAYAFHTNVRGIEEAGAAEHDFHAVARELRLGDVHLGLDHLVDPETEVGHGDLFLHVVVDAVDALVLEAGEVHDGFAHGLAGDGPGVDAGAADDLAALDDRHLAAALGRLNGGALSRRSGADNDDVVFLHSVAGRAIAACPRICR